MNLENECGVFILQPDERIIELQKEVKKLRRNLDEAERTRDLYNVCTVTNLFYLFNHTDHFLKF